MVSKQAFKTVLLCSMAAVFLHGSARPESPAPASGCDQPGGLVVHEIDPPHTPPAGKRVLDVQRKKLGVKKR